MDQELVPVPAATVVYTDGACSGNPGTGRMGVGGAAGPVRQWGEGADDESAHGDYGYAPSSEGPRRSS